MKLKKIGAFDNYVFANLTLGMLQNNGIVCSLQDENTVLADPLLSNAIGGIKLMVAEDQEQEALALLVTAENIYLKEINCQKCNTNDLQVIEKTFVPKTLCDRIKNQLLYGQPSFYSKKYVCANCGRIYNDLLC